jgi:hypothetical protein
MLQGMTPGWIEEYSSLVLRLAGIILVAVAADAAVGTSSNNMMTE